MARRSKNVESMEAISANFDFSGNPATRLDCEILEQFGALFIEDSERPSQNLYKNALKSEGEGGNNLDIHPKKVQ